MFRSQHQKLSIVEGARNQLFLSREVIMVDNFSSNSTIHVSEAFGVKVIRHRGHRGNPASQRNMGVLNSSGRYVLSLDSDQILETDHLRESAEICKRENADMVNIPEFFLRTNFGAKCLAFWKNCYSIACEKGSCRKVIILSFFLKSRMFFAGLQDENLHLVEDFFLSYTTQQRGMG